MSQAIALYAVLVISVIGYFASIRRCENQRKEIQLVKQGYLALAKREPISLSRTFHIPEIQALWHMLIVVTRRESTERPNDNIHAHLLSYGSQLTEAGEKVETVARILSSFILERLRPDAAASAVIVRQEDGSISLAHLSGIPQGRVEEIFLMHFESLLHDEEILSQASYQLAFPDRGSLLNLSAFGVMASVLVPLRGPDGIRGLLWVGFSERVTHITPERKLFIQALAQHAASAFYANQRMLARVKHESRERDFLLGASHDLRAPGQSALYALSDLINGEMGPLTPDQHLRLSIAHRALRDQLDILGDVLDFTKHQRGLLTPRSCRVRLQPILEEIHERHALESAMKGLEFECDPPPACDVMVDPHHLKRIITNLITNATKYTDTGGVQISFKPMTNILEMHVKDTGIGINESDRGSLFCEFGRLSNSAGRAGIGLGLAFTKALVELNGGYIFHAPNHPCGSIFGIGLPAISNISDSNSALGQPLRSILVVDDEAAACRAHIRQLQEFSREIIPASSAADALKLAQELRPDVILTDLHLGGESCEELLYGLREQCLRIPTLVLTGSADAALLESLEHDFGVSVYRKPIDRSALQLAITETIRKSQVSV